MKIQTGLKESQVLQRREKKEAALQIEGSCAQSGIIHATILSRGRAIRGWKKVVVGKAAKGRFKAFLKNVPPGGPYRLELRAGKEVDAVSTFFVGDVWLLAGQSNMEGVGDMIHPAKPHSLVRSFSLCREWGLATDPLHVLRESPDICHHGGQPLRGEEAVEFRRCAKKGVGVGIFFGRDMVRRSGVPQGLICTAHGGTSMDQWNPERKNEKGASLYYSMLQSVQATGQPVAGVLWYQGESDTNEKEKVHYTERMKHLVSATRRALRQPSLPWLVIQIGRVFDHEERAPAWNSIQEQERLLPDKIKNLEVVATVDLELDDAVHISSTAYPRLGRRLAGIADFLVHGNKKELAPPDFQEARKNKTTKTAIGPMGPSIDVTFGNVAGRLEAAGEPRGFTVVTKDGRLWPFAYKTTLHGNFARVHTSQLLPPGAKLHYGHGIMPICNITDGRGLSLPAFGPQPII